MRILSAASVLAVSVATVLAAAPSATAPRVLVVSVTKGFRHASIPQLEALVADLGKGGAFTVHFARTDAELAQATSTEGLAGYDAIVFASTTGDLPVPDPQALVSWVEEGHGVVGIHAAADTFHGFPPFLDMLGGEFRHHGPQVKVEVKVRTPGHPATSGLEPSFPVFDEIYQFKRFDPARVRLLLAMDRHPETGEPGEFPLAWTREPGKGRVFYTALGHREDVIESPWFRDHVRGGLVWVVAR